MEISAVLSSRCTKQKLICQKVFSLSMADTLVVDMIDLRSAHVVSVASVSAKLSLSSKLRFCSVACGISSPCAAITRAASSSKALPFVVLLAFLHMNPKEDVKDHFPPSSSDVAFFP